MNIEIMRAFVKLRLMLASNAELARKLEELAKKNTTLNFKVIFDAIRQLMSPADHTRRTKSLRSIVHLIIPGISNMSLSIFMVF